MTPRKRKEIDGSSFEGRFAKKLKKIREDKGISVLQLAEKSGIPPQTIHRWESTDSCPINRQLLNLSKALGVKVIDLIPEK